MLPTCFYCILLRCEQRVLVGTDNYDELTIYNLHTACYHVESTNFRQTTVYTFGSVHQR